MAAVRSAVAGGGVLFAKNSDRDYREAQYLQLIPRTAHDADVYVRLTYVDIPQARQTNTVLLSRPYWIWGAEIGANEHGLVIGNEAIFSKIEASAEDGVIGMDFLRLALERSASVDEAIDVITCLLREHGQSGICGLARRFSYHNAFILADPNGAKVLETVDREWVVKPITEKCAISNVLTIGADFDRSCASATVESRAIEAGLFTSGQSHFSFKDVFQDPERAASGVHRGARASALLDANSAPMAPADMFVILRDHVEGASADGGSGPRICAHRKSNPLGQTTASWVASLEGDRRVHWVTATAAPCTSVFKPLFLETGLPFHGPMPNADPDEATLWWRHERLRTYLERCDKEERAPFDRERDRLEFQFTEQVTACATPTNASDKVLAQTLIEECWRKALAFEAQWTERAVRAAS